MYKIDLCMEPWWSTSRWEESLSLKRNLLQEVIDSSYTILIFESERICVRLNAWRLEDIRDSTEHSNTKNLNFVNI